MKALFVALLALGCSRPGPAVATTAVYNKTTDLVMSSVGVVPQATEMVNAPGPTTHLRGWKIGIYADPYDAPVKIMVQLREVHDDGSTGGIIVFQYVRPLDPHPAMEIVPGDGIAAKRVLIQTRCELDEPTPTPVTCRANVTTMWE